MKENNALKNEKIEKILSPHPLSFMRFQSLCLFLLIWGVLLGWLVNFSEYKNLLDTFLIIILVWGCVLLLFGVASSLITIRWRIFFIYLIIFLGGVGLLLWQESWQKNTSIFIVFYSIAVSIIGFLMVEWYRRSHKYIISNLRLIFKGGVITKRERTLRYDKITDIDAKQGILGQIFGFGTIIPISQSGFGLGSDKSFAAGGVELGQKRAKFLGLFGGGKEVQTPRARSYYELHGVYPYKEIHALIESMVQGHVITPYQKEQVEVQKEQVAVQKEQVDIQKQMKALLKKQSEAGKEEKEGEE